tara:strand:- start:855 stop:1115 length:261 start_codon:yes stop_codon:yes gene_type:complete
LTVVDTKTIINGIDTTPQMNKKTAEYIKTLIAENEFQLKCERRSFDINCKQLGRITNPTYLKESNEELLLIKDAYSTLNKIIEEAK